MNEFLTVNGGDLRTCCNVYPQKQGDQPGTGYKQILWQISSDLFEPLYKKRLY